MSKILDILGVLSPLQMRLFTWRRGEPVGTDDIGNQYYRGKPIGDRKRERRWVIYAGAPEASEVPPEWHAWLHHQSDRVPDRNTPSPFAKPWVKDHQPNMTGTSAAYLPPGHTLKGGDRSPATGDYEAWTPGD